MIKVGRKEFQTLAQPIFVNGKRVKEVWVNRNQVYPEKVSGDLVKFKAELLYSVMRDRPKNEYTYVDYFCQDPFSYLFSISIKVVVVMQRSVDYYDNGIIAIASVDDASLPTGREYTSRCPDVLGINVQNDETFSGHYVLNPFIDNYGKNAPVYTSQRISMRNITSYGYQLSKCGVRISINPMPMPPKYKFAYNSYGSIQTGYRFEGTPIGILSSIASWNGQYLYNENSLRVDTYSRAYIGPSHTFENPFGDGILHIGRRLYNNLDYIPVWIDSLSVKYDIYNVYRYDEQKPNGIANISAQLSEFRIPITEILYIGSSSDAPEWASNVSESDL